MAPPGPSHSREAGRGLDAPSGFEAVRSLALALPSRLDESAHVFPEAETGGIREGAESAAARYERGKAAMEAPKPKKAKRKEAPANGQEDAKKSAKATLSEHASRHPLLYSIAPNDRPQVAFQKHDKVPRALRQVALDACCELELRGRGGAAAVSDVKERRAALDAGVARERLMARSGSTRVVYSHLLQKVKTELAKAEAGPAVGAAPLPAAEEQTPLPPSPLAPSLVDDVRSVRVRGHGDTLLAWEGAEGARPSLDCAVVRGSSARFFEPLILWMRAELDANAHHRKLSRLKKGNDARRAFHEKHAARLDDLCDEVLRPAAGAGRPLGGLFGHAPLPLSAPPADAPERALWHPPDSSAFRACERVAYAARLSAPSSVSHDAWLPPGWRAEQSELRALEEEEERVSA